LSRHDRRGKQDERKGACHHLIIGIRETDGNVCLTRNATKRGFFFCRSVDYRCLADVESTTAGGITYMTGFRIGTLLWLGLLAAHGSGAEKRGAWEVIGPGGGGAQFNPTVSAVDPNLVLVSCDMTGTYISNDGGDSWRMFNLRGVARFIVTDPLHSNVIYVATEGLYRSRDKGRTWELLVPRPEEVGRVVISGDHADERILLRDGTHVTVEALAVDPDDSNGLFSVLTRGNGAGLYHSKDAGGNWENLGDLPGGGRKIYVDPDSPKNSRTVYVAGVNTISVLEGNKLRQQKGPEGVNRFLDVAGGFPGGGKRPILYAISGIDWRGGTSGRMGLFVSTDGGAEWTSVPADFLSNAPKGTANLELRAVGASLRHPRTAYLSFRDHTSSLAASDRNMGVAKTVDAGKTWRMVWRDTDTAAAPNVRDPWINARYGPGWGENPFALGVSPENPDICFGTDFGRTTRTRDGGKNWQGVYARRLDDGGSTTTGLNVLTVNGIYFDPLDPSHWFVGFADLGLFEARGNGRSWKEATSRGVPREWENSAYTVVFDPAVKGRLWAVVGGVHDLPRPKMWRGRDVKTYQGGVVVSQDGGRSWRASIEGMGQTAATHILLDPKSPAESRTLYVCGFGRGVFKSTDGGRTWALKNNGLEGSEPFAWRMAQDSKGRLYLLVARRSSDGTIGTPLDGALYRSSDGAGHWEKLVLPAGCNGPNGLAIDPSDDGRLYLAAWGRRVAGGDSGGGIFLSTDAGKSWKNVLGRDQHIFDVSLDPRLPGVMYAAGFESSVWKSANRGESWTRVGGYNFKWGQRVFPDPNDPRMIYVCTFGGGIWHGPADGDPNAAEDIVTEVMKPGVRNGR
jgi:hypothetical protein